MVNVDQKEHEQIFPRAGWVEHDATEIWNNTREVIAGALAKADLNPHDIAAVGITNQRETARGVGQDHRRAGLQRHRLAGHPHRRHRQQLGALGGGADRYKDKVGLPLATYFSGPKIRWILDNVDGARAKAEAGNLVFGNIDTWVHLEPDRRHRRRRARHRRRPTPPAPCSWTSTP